MAFTQTQLDALENAISSGATRVSYDGKSVEYASLDVMMRVRDIIRRALGLAPAASATIMVAHDRGYPGPATWGDDGLFSGF
jgi:hypothetical protein